MNKALALFTLALTSQASHLDAAPFKWDSVKFKTKTDCQLDTYPQVRNPHSYSNSSL